MIIDDQNITEEVKIKSFEELRDKYLRDITRQQIRAERRSISKGKKRYYKEFLRQTKDNPIGHKTIKSLFSSNLDRLFPLKITPIDPVIVPGFATIFSAPTPI